MEKIEKLELLLEELKIKFNTEPRRYEKNDFKLLLNFLDLMLKELNNLQTQDINVLINKTDSIISDYQDIMSRDNLSWE